jgi:hypothetical protein
MVWRGHRTRKIISEFFEIVLNGGYKENEIILEEHVEFENFNEEEEDEKVFFYFLFYYLITFSAFYI